MSYTIKGRIIDIQDIQQITETFSKREFVLEVEAYNNQGALNKTDYIPFQLTNGNCDRIESKRIGDIVTVHFNLGGNKWVKDGTTRYFPQLTAWKIDGEQSHQPQSPYPAKPPEQRTYTKGPKDSEFIPEPGDDLPF